MVDINEDIKFIYRIMLSKSQNIKNAKMHKIGDKIYLDYESYNEIRHYIFYISKNKIFFDDYWDEPK